MPITGTVPLTGVLAPTSELATYPVTDPRWGKGGLRTVGTTADRDSIPQLRREEGMIVYVSGLSGGLYYTLKGGTGNEHWEIFQSGTGDTIFNITNTSTTGFYGLTGPTSGSFPQGISGTGETGDRLLIATGPPADPFRNYIRFGNAWFQTGVVGTKANTSLAIVDSLTASFGPVILKGNTAHSLTGETISVSYLGGVAPATASVHLVNPNQGTGFPVYFPTSSMDTLTFTNQTITAGVGESVVLRLVVTGQPGPAYTDIYDLSVKFGNAILWGSSSLTSLNGSQIQSLDKSVLAASSSELFPHTITASAGNGEFIFYAFPTRMGFNIKHSINSGGYGGMHFQGEYGIPGDASVTSSNSLGFTESFYVVRSRNENLGDSLEVRTVKT
jgi:hypothetical protein